MPPTPDDTAIIMYTSGSTGAPKGVILSHHNLVSSMVGYAVGLNTVPDDIYLAYLPLAHVLELIAGEFGATVFTSLFLHSCCFCKGWELYTVYGTVIITHC